MELPSLVLVITSVTLLIFVLKFVREVKRSKTQNGAQKLPPGPWKLPIIGSMHHLASALPHRALTNLAKKYGPLMHLQIGEISMVVISSPRLAKEVMATHDLAFENRPKLLAATIITYYNTDIGFSPYGAYWRQMRKICSIELLSSKKVKSFGSIREDEVRKLTESIRALSGAPINLSGKIYSLIPMITCRAAFGKTCQDQDTFMAVNKLVVEMAGGFDVADVFPSLKLLQPFTGMRPKLIELHKKMDQILESIIDEHKESVARMEGGAYWREEEDLVDVLLRLKESGELEIPITLNNIKAIILDVFSAGTDSYSATIEWAITELIRNPQVMDKAQAELRKVLKGMENIDENDIQLLGYLKQVIQETLRLHPILPLLLPRECREQCEIDGYIIPIKTKVIVNAWAIGRDPAYWKDAESFIPERFDSSKNTIGAKFEYLPFGAGRRMCPGLLMGLANVELPLAQLLYQFNWKLPNGMKSEDLDVDETFGSNVRRKNNLYLIPTPHYDRYLPKSKLISMRNQIWPLNQIFARK